MRYVLKIIMSGVLLIIVCTVCLYITAPVDDLRRVITYTTPYKDSTRQAGFGLPEHLMVEEMQQNSLPEKLNLRTLKPRLQKIRERGYEQSKSDTVPGITDMAFPIFGSSQPGAIASLNMPYLKQRDATMSLAQSRQVLQVASQNITELMGGAGHLLAGV
jgi:hypothetical protein